MAVCVMYPTKMLALVLVSRAGTILVRCVVVCGLRCILCDCLVPYYFCQVYTNIENDGYIILLWEGIGLSSCFRFEFLSLLFTALCGILSYSSLLCNYNPPQLQICNY